MADRRYFSMSNTDIPDCGFAAGPVEDPSVSDEKIEHATSMSAQVTGAWRWSPITGILWRAGVAGLQDVLR
ncbi:MAG: hypothetical protein E6H53_12380 [Betaproteobacteria bacterium]|nr:MAG: hypothetical protein E6H53_12380 [Betaproteobacteria bacterium]